MRNLTSANKKQVAGTHYKEMPMNPWDFIFTMGLDFFEGNIVKYICRYHHTQNVNDLLKVQHYAEKLVELKGQGNDHNRGRSKKPRNGRR